MADLLIERLGGIGGFGLPGSRVASRGHLQLDALSAAERTALNALFEHPGKAAKRHRESAIRDGFRYRITHGAQSIEVAEDQVPTALLQCVRDELI